MKLIDADEILMDAEHMSAFRCSLANMGDLTILVASQETVDAVPVVRCRECKLHTSSAFYPDMLFCQEHGRYVDTDGYCYLGERKGGTGNG